MFDFCRNLRIKIESVQDVKTRPKSHQGDVGTVAGVLDSRTVPSVTSVR